MTLQGTLDETISTQGWKLLRSQIEDEVRRIDAGLGIGKRQPCDLDTEERRQTYNRMVAKAETLENFVQWVDKLVALLDKHLKERSDAGRE